MSRKLLLLTFGLVAAWLWLALLVSAQTPVDGATPAASAQLSPVDESLPLPSLKPTMPMTPTAYARVNVTYESVDGWFGPGVTVWYTVADSMGTVKGSGSGVTGPDCWLTIPKCACDIAPGDEVEVESDAGFSAVLVPITIDGRLDPDAETVAGQMYGGTFPGSGYLWLWSGARMISYQTDFSIAADGSYLVDLSGVFDIWVGDRAAVWYLDANGNYVGVGLHSLRISLNYGNDSILAETTPLATVTMTVAGKATFIAQASPDGYLDTIGMPGAWDPAPPDIVPGDVVMVTAGGYVAEVNPVGMIVEYPDAARDIVTGTINAPWYTETVRVRCEVWAANAPPAIELLVSPDGGSYSCNFRDVGFNLLPGQWVAVQYMQPDVHRVINIVQAQGLAVYVPMVEKND